MQNHAASNQVKCLLGGPVCGPSFAASPALPPPELPAPSCQILHIGKYATYKNMLHQQQAFTESRIANLFIRTSLCRMAVAAKADAFVHQKEGIGFGFIQL